MAGQLHVCCLADQILHTENNYEGVNFFSVIMAVALMEWRQILLTIIIVVEANEVEGFRGMEFSLIKSRRTHYFNTSIVLEILFPFLFFIAFFPLALFLRHVQCLYYILSFPLLQNALRIKVKCKYGKLNIY